MARAVLWFRRDLRLDDLPALRAAAEAGPDGVVALFVADPALLGPAGPNRRRFLTAALAALDAELGGALVVRRGDPVRRRPRRGGRGRGDHGGRHDRLRSPRCRPRRGGGAGPVGPTGVAS